MLSLGRGGGNCALAKFLAGRFTGPGTRIDVAHRAQPFFGFGEGREIAHVQPESLTPFFEAATHEKAETLELRLFRVGQCHRCRR